MEPREAADRENDRMISEIILRAGVTDGMWFKSSDVDIRCESGTIHIKLPDNHYNGKSVKRFVNRIFVKDFSIQIQGGQTTLIVVWDDQF